MAYKVQRPCRVCGKLFTPCGDCERDNTAFHWRTIACSYECGKEYLRRIVESRQKDVSKEDDTSTAVKDSVEQETVQNEQKVINEEFEKTETVKPQTSAKIRNRHTVMRSSNK